MCLQGTNHNFYFPHDLTYPWYLHDPIMIIQQTTAIINLKTSFPFKGTKKDLFTLGYPGLENPISSNQKEKLR